MAKAYDALSTIVWIWLRDALDLATESLGSRNLAKALLTEWLGAGKLPWSCMAWQAPDAEGIAELEEAARDAEMCFRYIPSACREGEPEFWRADLTIGWEDNMAHENSVVGARALGITVSREHLLTLLPDESREGEKVHGAGRWIAVEVERMKGANEIPQGIRISEFARKLASLMNRAAASDKSLRPIKAKSIENMLRDLRLWPIAPVK